MNEDWELLKTFFPPRWRDAAHETGATKGLRQDKDEEAYLRTILLHVGSGYSLRETATRASQAGWGNLSDVALLKRLRKSESWLHNLCQHLFAENHYNLPAGQSGLRLIDATEVQEPGKTGSLWRIHYSISIPSLTCDYFELSPVKGAGTGESFKKFNGKTGEHFLADRGYCNAQGIAHIVKHGANVTVRLNPQNVRIFDNHGERYKLLENLETLRASGSVGDWQVKLSDGNNQNITEGRICVIRKSVEAIRKAKNKLNRRANKNGEILKPETLIYAEYVMVFTTVKDEQLKASEILETYRLRWQIELVFKRFKQIASFGHLPKYDDVSSRSWIYGKLFVALLTEKLISSAESISPWGYKIL